MSQSPNPPDTQVLLQSMLQRLKLQPGREGQAYLHTPVPISPASNLGQDRGSGASDLQKVNNSVVNGFGTNGIPSRELRSSGREIQQPGHGGEVDRGLISFPTQKDNIDGDTGENRPWITPTGTGQLLPARSLKDADITSFERTDGERVSFGSSALTSLTSGDKDAAASMGQNQEQGFKPKVYMWSMMPTDANLGTRGQDDKVFHMGNGGFGDLQSKDRQIVLTGQEAANSSSRRQQRSSENKTRRWTQKLKERWKDRKGSFSKAGKEEGVRGAWKSEQRTEISPQNQLLTEGNLTNTSNKEKERTLPSLDSSDPSKTPPTHTEDSTVEGHMRSTSDFEFGLGSFSLLDEIITGQEWAKFLNPNLSAASANQRPPEEAPSQLRLPSNPHDSGPSSVPLNQHGGVTNQWSFRGTEASPGSYVSMATTSPDAFLPVNMDVSEGKQAAAQADQSEPMEHGYNRRPSSLVQPADILMNSALKSRAHLNRKRQHQSAEMPDKMLQTENISDGKDREGSTSSPRQTSNHEMEETGESQHDNVMPPPLSASFSTPFPRAPRGVLKHSISQNSESSSVEIETKRRRVEDNRRVHFSEEVVTIEPPELDMDLTDSEEEEEEEEVSEEDSVIEQESEVEHAAIPVSPTARRAALPAWILALKRRNTGRKPR